MALPPSYQAALDYIYNYVDYERRRSVAYTEAAWNLDRARQVLAALDNPQQRYQIVHVAGSKGKGSTAAAVESILRAAGLRVGFYTSPHLHTFRERIRVGGVLIGRDEVVSLLDRCKPAIEAVPGITTFEIMTVLALLYFAQQGVNWAVLEVGLGGRLDATNVVTPEVSVITRISLEHTALLGDTLEAIAREKAGIIKPGVPVVVASQAPEAQAAIEEIAARQAAPLTSVSRDWSWQPGPVSLTGQVFSVHRRTPRSPAGSQNGAGAGQPALGTFDDLATPLLGAHQLENQTTAVAIAAELASRGAPLGEQAIRDGIASVYWPARLEVLQAGDSSSAAVVVDSAHTAESATLLCDSVERLFPQRRLVLVLGISNDKDARAILAAFGGRAAALHFTRSRHPRATDPRLLADLANEAVPRRPVTVDATVGDALASALAGADGDTVVCVAGSLFIAAEGREAWLALHPGVFPAGDWAYEAEPMAPDWQVSQTLASLPPVPEPAGIADGGRLS